MSTFGLPEGFRYVSGRFQSRFQGRFGAVSIDTQVLPLPAISDTPQQLKEKVAKLEKHFHKLGERNRRETALTGKAGRKPEPETVELYQYHFVEAKPWPESFALLWSKPGRKAPVAHDRGRVEAHLRKRVKAYAASRLKVDSSASVH